MRFVRCAAAALPVFLVPAIALAQPEPKAPPTAGTAAAPTTPAPAQPQPDPSGADLPPAPPAPTGTTTQRPPLVPNTSITPSMLPRTGTPITTGAVGTDGTRDTERLRGDVGAKPSDVYAEDWWSFSRPILELHGYFRMRAEMFHNFALGRLDSAPTALWQRPSDGSYMQWDRTTGTATPQQVPYCGSPLYPGGIHCQARTQSSGNLRFRVNPELHISDNLRILSQIDLLDNLVMGSTPEGYANSTNPSASSTGYWRTSSSGYVPIGAYANSQETPTAGQNSYRNSISVKRVWGEYVTPIGQIRFGRMPDHWGLGMVHNAGNTYDSDYQSTVDRVMFMTGIKPLDLYVGAAWDFPNEGASSATLNNSLQGQPYDVAQTDDVNQYALIISRRRNPALQRLDLARGGVVVNGGMYLTYRNQFLASDQGNNGVGTATGQNLGLNSDDLRLGLERRGYSAWTPDLWFQLLYKKFRFELEGVAVAGSIETIPGGAYRNDSDTNNNGYKLRQYGFASQTEFKAVEDRLRLNFGTGWSSGDPNATSLVGGNNGFQAHPNSNKRTYSQFAFHPDYRLDLILFRHILNRVQGAYYFRPSVDYDFSRSPNGQRLGGGAAIIWSRASEFIQTPGHKRDLGVEIDLTLYYQSKDGALNDDPDKMGGFFTMLQYGVLFPLWGLDPLTGDKDAAAKQGVTLSTSAAQTLRWYAGILF